MRILFLGNNWLGWQVLKWLARQDDEIAGVAVHPAGCAKYADEIRQVVRRRKCAIVDGSQLGRADVLDQIRSLQADMAVSVLFGYILRTEFLAIFPRGCINLHPALLPHNRGAFPNVWSIVNRTPAGVTLHYVDQGIDTGDLVAQKEVEVRITDTGASLYRRLEQEGLRLFQENWPAIRAGKCSRTPQPYAAGSCHRVRDVEQIDEIDLQKSYRAGDLLNIIRARTFPPYPGAHFVHEGRKIYLHLELKDESEVAGD